eukprot:CAMPEP_0204201562 /NCGR_PEP_ID=MMETSP0361-20130328/67565_1 /ASSEMBLY_ACC=CAM_ASM_000343 /TAXON_ID=268821 /ORGANISM="Scrippsiella Hangoei, Strain SHTV-5" /LENGTH=74 /DNA_ID=CAMNT_0051164219 /DNA_START=183 /DNA_END=407 /DNA_ORIENTATION=-
MKLPPPAATAWDKSKPCANGKTNADVKMIASGRRMDVWVPNSRTGNTILDNATARLERVPDVPLPVPMKPHTGP